MAFANLFTSLSDIADVKQPAHADRIHPGNDSSGNGRKRKIQYEQKTPYKKKQCFQEQTFRAYDAPSVSSDVSWNNYTHPQNFLRDNSSVGSKKDNTQNHSGKAGHNQGWHNKNKNNHNLNKQQGQKKKTKWQNNQDHQKKRGRPANRGGRKGGEFRRNVNEKQSSEVTRKRLMTQEFKDQNALLVDGRLICRHFISGKCIKGEECQLEHVQGYNNLLKEACKFYIQGACTKGESCPYMHNSFPCKFLHRKGKCYQGENCRFSHEPLNDLTNKLLDEALKRESELYALAKKAEQESSGQPLNTEEPENKDGNQIPDILLHPLKPKFYQSVETSADQETTIINADDQAEEEETVAPHLSDAAISQSPPSCNLNQKEQVCYSVEAVLGPQLSKPFPCFFSSQRSQESSVSSSDSTADSANQSEAPYSVTSVLRSFKTVKTASCPSAQTGLQNTNFKEPSNPLLKSETEHKEAWLSQNNSKEKMFKSLPSLQTYNSPMLKTCTNSTVDSADPKTHVGNLDNHPQKSFFTSKEDTKESRHQSMDYTNSLYCQTEGIVPFRPRTYKTLYSTSSNLKSSEQSNVCAPKADTLTSFKPYYSSSGFTESKVKASDPSEFISTSIKSSITLNPASLPEQTGKQSTASHLHPKETTTGGSSKVGHEVGLAVECRKTLKKPFNSLFANPLITNFPLPKNDSAATNVIKSSCPGAKSADSTRTDLKTAVEAQKSPSRSFVSLFSAPLTLSAASSGSEKHVLLADAVREEVTKPLNQDRTDGTEILHVPKAPGFSSDPEKGNKRSSTEGKNKLVDPDLSFISGSKDEQPTCPTSNVMSETVKNAPQLLPDVSSCRKDASKSILRTLFQYLEPYQQDGEQQDGVQIGVLSGSADRNKNNKGFVSEERQMKRDENGRRKEKLKSSDIPEEQPSPQTAHVSSEAAASSTLSRELKPQVRECGTNYVPSNTGIEVHIEPSPKIQPSDTEQHVPEKMKTPLKDLFKALDMTGF